MRILITLTASLLGLLLLWQLLFPSAPEEPLSLLSSSECLQCHPGVAAEWEASHHKFAFENPEVRRLSNDFANQECLACHAPRPVLQFAAGERVLARQAERAQGVDCLACHSHPDGGVGTSNPQPNGKAPCRPRHEARMASVDHCAACHNQHKTVEQWRAAPEELKGDDCLHCHMPEVWRSGGRKGRAHGFPAGHDLSALQSAVKLEIAQQDGAPHIRLSNIGCGHNFPTDERSRAADLQLRWQRADGSWEDWQHVYRFRDPYRDETDLTNTQLPSGESASFPFPAPLEEDNPGLAAEARLMYRTNPFQADQDSTEVARVPWSP